MAPESVVRRNKGKSLKISYLVFPAEFCFAVGEMTAITFDAVFILGEVLAQRSLVQVVQLLAPWLRLRLYDRHGYDLWHAWGRAALTHSARRKVFSHLLILTLQARSKGIDRVRTELLGANLKIVGGSIKDDPRKETAHLWSHVKLSLPSFVAAPSQSEQRN